MMSLNEASQFVIGKAIKVHSRLGPGLLESSYQECLCYEIRKAGVSVQKEKPLPLVYDEVRLDCGYRVDLFVENRLVVEVKAVDVLNDVHLAQVLTYLKLSDCKLGLLLNFNVVKLKYGIRRVVNSF